ISGGGRCNVTHDCFDPEVFSNAYPRGQKELRWAFEQFQANDTVSWFEQRGIELKTESDGRMFPTTDDSATIIKALKSEAREQDVEVQTKIAVKAAEQLAEGGYRLRIRNHPSVTANSVIIATGGSNRSNRYDWLRNLGHSIVHPVPSLFTFNFRNQAFEDLAGISVENASVAIKGTHFRHSGPILITHWGLSGPAVLKTSAWAARYLNTKNYRFTITVNWVHPLNEKQIRSRLKKLRDANAPKQVDKQDQFPLPNRLCKRLLKLTEINTQQRWAELSNKQIHLLTQSLGNAHYKIEGKTTYKDEFVTSGGLPLEEINMATMESKRCPNIYFAGEVLNIDGITGGFNFQSAWTTGWIAAKAISRP